MTSTDDESDLAEEAWDHGGQIYGELERRLSAQFAEQLLGGDAMPRLQTVARTLGKYEPFNYVADHIRDLCGLGLH